MTNYKNPGNIITMRLCSCERIILPQDEDGYKTCKKCRAYHTLNKQKKGKYWAEWNNSSSGRFSNHKNRAKARNIKWEITKEEFEKIIKEHLKNNKCYYCHIPVEFAFNKRWRNLAIGIFQNMTHWSLDRKDNAEGYLIDNVVFACCICNEQKGSFYSEEEFLKIGQEIIKPKWHKLFL